MTAYGKKEVFVDALKNHCSGFIEKPFTLVELIEKIEEVRLRLSTTNERRRGIARAGEQQYSRLVESAPGIFYSFSNKKGGIYYSSKVEPILGYSPFELYDNPFLWRESIHPDDQKTVERAFGGTEKEEDFDLEYRIRDAFGNWRWFRDRSIGIRNHQDETIIEGFVIDFTEQRRLNEV